MKRLGIIIPFRDRELHLLQSAPILKKIGTLYVIEQVDDKPFNRAKLLNIGYADFKNEFDYFAAHDVDLIPEEADYSFCENPCHLATMAEQFGYKMPYAKYFGGVTLLPNEKFEQVNGFSNEYFGYGGEDDELRRRFEEKNITIESRQCRFKSLPHEIKIDHDLRMKNNSRLLAPVDWNDGLSNCKYEIVDCEDLEDYTLLQIRL